MLKDRVCYIDVSVEDGGRAERVLREEGGGDLQCVVSAV
jgi:hypothetical protein